MTGHRWLSRVATVGGFLVAALVGGAPAWADSSDNSAIQAGTLPVTAADFSAKAGSFAKACDPAPTEDVWYFATVPLTQIPDATPGVEPLPEATQSAAPELPAAATVRARPAFVSVTLTFAVPEAAEPRVKSIGPNSTGAASIRTPAGWTLIAATAEVRGIGPAGRATFVLAGACAARTTEQMFVRAMPEPTVKERTRPQPATPRLTASPTRTKATVSATTPVPTAIQTTPSEPRHAPADAAPSLPVTGLDISGMLTLGVTLVVAGVVLLIVRRQRDKPVPRAEPTDWY